MSTTHQLRCTNCGARIAADAAQQRFPLPRMQWPLRGDLSLESRRRIAQPDSGRAAPDVRLPNPGALRYRWQELRTSTMAIDQSGVWRFRDLLPIVENYDNVVTLREGNTPLYEMPRCAEIAGRRLAAGQAPGHESHRLVQGHRHDRGDVGRRRARLQVGRLRVHRQYFGRHGGLCGARGAALHRVYSRGQDCLGQALAVDGLRRA